jgi:class 3 adenylate cyclase
MAVGSGGRAEQEAGGRDESARESAAQQTATLSQRDVAGFAWLSTQVTQVEKVDLAV